MNNEQIDAVIESIIAHEGGYVDHPNDTPTKYGITQTTLKQFLKRSVTRADVANLQRDDAKAIYHSEYVGPFVFIPNYRLANFMANATVQHGLPTAVGWLQKALGLVADGNLGPVTRTTCLQLSSDALMDVLFAVLQMRLKYYGNILQQNAGKRVFAAGWLNRIADDLIPPVPPPPMPFVPGG
jgi:lysozyme family protein